VSHFAAHSASRGLRNNGEPTLAQTTSHKDLGRTAAWTTTKNPPSASPRSSRSPRTRYQPASCSFLSFFLIDRSIHLLCDPLVRILVKVDRDVGLRGAPLRVQGRRRRVQDLPAAGRYRPQERIRRHQGPPVQGTGPPFLFRCTLSVAWYCIDCCIACFIGKKNLQSCWDLCISALVIWELRVHCWSFDVAIA
jgi:hypothetical protein